VFVEYGEVFGGSDVVVVPAAPDSVFGDVFYGNIAKFTESFIFFIDDNFCDVIA